MATEAKPGSVRDSESRGLRFGLHAVNSGLADGEGLARVGKEAEALGFVSLWMGEHVVLPDPRVSPSPLEPDFPILDPIVALAFVASVTTRLRLGTGVIVLPQRNPLVLAKQLASLDALSGGRLLFGVGAGYLEPELRAIGVAMSERGARTDEYLAAIIHIWTQDRAAFRGRYVSFDGVTARPRPQKSPHPPIVVGGASPAAFARTIEHGYGWYGYALGPEDTVRHLAKLVETARVVARPPSLGRLKVLVSPTGRVDRAAARQFEEAGVDELIISLPLRKPIAGVVEFMRMTAKELLA